MINLERIKSEKPIKELLEFSIINIDKPSGPTSFNIDVAVKEALNIGKSSHFGTLDPAVTGVLPVALSRACRLMPYFIKSKKTYIGIMRLHKETSKEELNRVVSKFIGKISQTPPIKSSVKRVERKREIYSFNVLEISENKKNVLFLTEVEAGTYIRKLIDDMGKELEGAHMLELRRTKASIFEEKDSYTIYQLLDAVKKYKEGDESDLRKMLIPGEIISEVTTVIQVKKESLKKLYHGSPLFKEHLAQKEPNLKSDKPLKLSVFHKDKFIGVFARIDSKNKDHLGSPEFILQPIK